MGGGTHVVALLQRIRDLIEAALPHVGVYEFEEVKEARFPAALLITVAQDLKQAQPDPVTGLLQPVDGEYQWIVQEDGGKSASLSSAFLRPTSSRAPRCAWHSAGCTAPAR